MESIEDRGSASRGDTGKVLFEGTDVEQLHGAVSDHLGPHKLRVLEDSPIRGRYRAEFRGAIGVYGLGYGADVEIIPAELPNIYHVHWPIRGSGAITVDGNTVLGECVVGPGQRLRMRWDASSYTMIVRIPQDRINRAVHDRIGAEVPSGVRFEPGLRRDDPAVRGWIATARRMVASEDLLSRSPIAAGLIEDALVHGLLDIHTHSASLALAAQPAGVVLPAAVRKAVAFCHDNAGNPVSVADIARAARLSVRLLQEAFRTHLGVTPMAYLRRIRLEAAHRDLVAIAAGQAEGTVAEVALRWGFAHLGRFARTYRLTYGQPPSVSVRRVR